MAGSQNFRNEWDDFATRASGSAADNPYYPSTSSWEPVDANEDSWSQPKGQQFPPSWTQPQTETGGAASSAQPVAQKPATPAWVWALITLLSIAVIVALIALLGWAFGWFGGDSDRAGATSNNDNGAVSQSSTAPAADPADKDAAKGSDGKDDDKNDDGNKASATASTDPSAASSTPSAAQAPAPSRTYTNAWAGSNVTSGPFVDSVYSAFVANYNATGNANSIISAYSPTTGTTYTMYCTDYGSYVSCSGGNNAVVNIS